MARGWQRGWQENGKGCRRVPRQERGGEVCGDRLGDRLGSVESLLGILLSISAYKMHQVIGLILQYTQRVTAVEHRTQYSSLVRTAVQYTMIRVKDN